MLNGYYPVQSVARERPMSLFDVAPDRGRRQHRQGTTYSMDSIAIGIDAFAVLLAGAVFALRRAARWKRCVAAFASLAGAFTSPGLMAAGSVPEWPRIVAVCAMFVAFSAVAWMVSPIGGAPDDDGSDGLTRRDWDPNSPDTPGGGTDDFEPEWWPEFEREFAEYVALAPVVSD